MCIEQNIVQQASFLQHVSINSPYRSIVTIFKRTLELTSVASESEKFIRIDCKSKMVHI